MTDEIPEDVVSDAERLTRLARDAVDDAETTAHRTRRDELLEEYDYTARVRDERDGETLVLYPSEWVEDDTVRFDRIEDTSRAVEIPLSGAGLADEWEEVDRHNRAVADAVREEWGGVHGDNADAFADFMSNHYARRVETARTEEVMEFLTEYFPRNAWPSDRQKTVIESSIRRVFEETDSQVPDFSR